MPNPRAPLPKLFENEALIVVDKPAGWLSVPSRIGEQDERPCVGWVLQAELATRLWPVHRLDVEVSGLLLFAKHAEAHRAAGAWFEGRDVRKTYLAWVASEESLAERTGRAPDGVECWESRLLRGKKRAYEHAAGKSALTEARWVADRTVGASVVAEWELHPLTGRAHQLRYEMSRRVGPIWGDVLYGSQRSFPAGGIALRAMGLDFSRVPPADRWGLPSEIRLSAGLLERDGA